MSEFYITIPTHTGRALKSNKWVTTPIPWPEFVERCTSTPRTHESAALYADWQKHDKSKCTAAKDVGGFVGATLHKSPGPRNKRNISTRTAVTLDADTALPDFKSRLQAELSGVAFVAYTTHSHTQECPRWRVVIPLRDPSTVHAAEAAARRIAGRIGMEFFDPSTFQRERLFFWPSTSSDGVFDYAVGEGEPLDVDEVLASYDNWQDPGEGPAHTSEDKTRSADVEKIKQESRNNDPRLKPGYIGAFCRVYPMAEAISKFLPDVYKQERGRRYTYLQGSSAAGGHIMEDGLFYSHHSTDPAGGGHARNAYDLVRLHKFGHLDGAPDARRSVAKLPSALAMDKLCAADPEVKKEVIRASRAAAIADFAEYVTVAEEEETAPPVEDWETQLETDRKGNVLNTLANFSKIMLNDPRLKYVRYDEFAGRDVDTRGEFAARPDSFLDDCALGRMREYIETRYAVRVHRDTVPDTLTRTQIERSFHPVKECIEAVEWDGVPRIESLLIRYFGADDTPLNRVTIRKYMIAGVARIYDPGCKFDSALTLCGPQGTGKSTFLRIIGGRWFTDQLDLCADDKTKAEQTAGKWIVEILELAGYRKAEQGRIKKWITALVDEFRAAYAHNKTHRPRQFIIAATTNEDNFLQEAETGNRRFWVVDVPGADRDWFAELGAEVPQLWAEALHYYRAGEDLLLPADLRRGMEARQIEKSDAAEDPLKDLILRWLKRFPRTLVHASVFYDEMSDCIARLPRSTKDPVRRFNAIMATLPEWEKVNKYNPDLGRKAKCWEYTGPMAAATHTGDEDEDLFNL